MSEPTPQELFDAAVAYVEAGWSITPLRGKVPIKVGWTTASRASKADCYSWFIEDGHTGIGVICGKISGGLSVVDVEGRLLVDTARMARVLERAQVNGSYAHLEAAFNKAITNTPSGGCHLSFEITDGEVPPNRKLAYAKTSDGDQLLAETRGEGGQVAAPPGVGRVWRRSTIPGGRIKVTLAEHAAIVDAYMSIDESDRTLIPPAQAARSGLFAQPRSDSVADVLAEAMLDGTLNWGDVLDRGWQLVGYDTKGRSLWLRPEYGAVKPTSSSSAHGFERYADGASPVMVNHSSAVVHLPIGDGHRLTPARVWALSHFDGDQKAAYHALEHVGDADPRVAALPLVVRDRVARWASARHGRAVRTDAARDSTGDSA